MEAVNQRQSDARSAYIERDGRFWQVVIPAAPEDGMDLVIGPHLTRLGARISLRFHCWINRKEMP